MGKKWQWGGPTRTAIDEDGCDDEENCPANPTSRPIMSHHTSAYSSWLPPPQAVEVVFLT